MGMQALADITDVEARRPIIAPQAQQLSDNGADSLDGGLADDMAYPDCAVSCRAAGSVCRFSPKLEKDATLCCNFQNRAYG